MKALISARTVRRDPPGPQGFLLHRIRRFIADGKRCSTASPAGSPDRGRHRPQHLGDTALCAASLDVGTACEDYPMDGGEVTAALRDLRFAPLADSRHVDIAARFERLNLVELA